MKVLVERLDPGLAFPHRGQDVDLVEAHPGTPAIHGFLPDEGGDRGGILDRLEGEVRGRVEERHPPFVDAVGIDDDPALARLAEDRAKPHDRDTTRPDQVREDVAEPHRRKLIRIADEEEPHPLRHGAHERVSERQVDHARLVDDEEIAFQGVRLVAQEVSALRGELQEPVNGLRLASRHLGEPIGGSARRRGEKDVGFPKDALERGDDGPDDGALARAGPARDDRHRRRQRLADRLFLLGAVTPCSGALGRQVEGRAAAGR